MMSDRFVVRWFNEELSQHMELYVATPSKTYVLTENHCCDIIATSRVYIEAKSGVKRLLPPYAWKSPKIRWNVERSAASHFTNACNMYRFETFDELLAYLKILHATKDGVPFFRLQKQLADERLSSLANADRAPPQRKRPRREKVYVSS